MRSLSPRYLSCLLALAVASSVEAVPGISLSIQAPQRFSFAADVVEVSSDNPTVAAAVAEGQDLVITPQGNGLAEVKYRLKGAEDYQYLSLQIDLGELAAMPAEPVVVDVKTDAAMPAVPAETVEVAVPIASVDTQSQVAGTDIDVAAEADAASQTPVITEVIAPEIPVAQAVVAVQAQDDAVPGGVVQAEAEMWADALRPEAPAAVEPTQLSGPDQVPAMAVTRSDFAALPVPPRDLVEQRQQPVLLAQALDQASALELEGATSELSESAQGALTLAAAVQRGIRLHPKVRSAQANVSVAETEIGIAESGYWPSMELSAGPDLGGDMAYDLAMTQTIYDWGQVSSEVAKASASKRQQVQTLLQTQDDVALEVVNACIDLKLANDNLGLVRFYQQQLDYLLQLVQQRGASGYSDNTEISRVQQALAYAEEQIAVEMKVLLDAQTNYRVLLDLEPVDNPVILPPVSNLFGMLTDTTLLGRAINRAPEVRGAQEQVAQIRSEVDSASATLKPRLQLEASSLRRDVDGTATEDTVVGLRVKVNPMQGLSSFQQVTAQRQRLEQAQFNADTKRLDLRKEVEMLGNKKVVLSDQLNALNVQITQVDNVRQTYREQFMVGLRKIDDLISIERENFEAERQRLETISEYHRITYDAASQLGLLAPMLGGKLDEALQP